MLYDNLGPYAWVKYVPGEPILPNQPNEGSVKRRNEKKRMRLRRAFILVCVFPTKRLWARFFFFLKMLEILCLSVSAYVLSINCRI